jgi:hypothetical protein
MAREENLAADWEKAGQLQVAATKRRRGIERHSSQIAVKICLHKLGISC